MGIIPKPLIAALIGTAFGTTAGVWSLRQPAASVHISASPAVTTATDGRVDAASSTPSTSAPTNGETLPSTVDDGHVLQRARTLARRPDVSALMALREDVARRASEQGIAGSPSVKGELDAIDVSLNEARLLRLKLDAQELRSAESKSTR